MINGPDEAISERLVQPTTSRLFLLVMGACLIYAGIRYHIAERVPIAQAPLYVFKKVSTKPEQDQKADIQIVKGTNGRTVRNVLMFSIRHSAPTSSIRRRR